MRPRWTAGLLGAACAAGLVAFRPTTRAPSPPASPQACPAPRPSQWAAIRDSLWPRLTHTDGDSAWAHLDPAGLPGQSASWCDPLLADPSARDAGPALYVQYCATCHGDQGRGDGPGAAVSDPPPYAFTRPEFAGMREPPGPAVLYAILTRGIDGTPMQGYAGTLSGWERLAVIAFILDLPGPAAVRSSRAWADSLRSRHRNQD